jgi:branched-subunit amino acid aminotransferase/4-amino-4-deoxychorismate lyase
MRQPRTKRGRATAPDGELLELGRDLERLRRRCRRLHLQKQERWAQWSAAIAETTALARKISRLAPTSLEGLLVRYNAVAWMALEADDVIVDRRARLALVSLGRAMRQLSAE